MAKDYWETPCDVVDSFNVNHPFTIDVACEEHNAKAPLALTSAFDHNWADLQAELGGWIWCNPPYSDPTRWVDGIVDFGVRAVMLVNAATSSKWFHKCMANAAEMIVFDGRIAFYDPDIGTLANGNDRSQVAFIFDPMERGDLLRTLSIAVASVQTCRDENGRLDKEAYRVKYGPRHKKSAHRRMVEAFDAAIDAELGDSYEDDEL